LLEQAGFEPSVTIWDWHRFAPVEPRFSAPPNGPNLYRDAPVLVVDAQPAK
jgi:hypothetical protein